MFTTGKEFVTDLPKFVLYQDLDGTIYDVELPLTSNVDPEELRESLGLRARAFEIEKVFTESEKF